MRLLIAFLLPAAVWAAGAVRIEAEDLELTGGWQHARGQRVVGSYLQTATAGGTAPAAGAIRIPTAGRWRLWVRAKDFPDYLPGTRNFSVRLGERRSATLFGRHRRAGLDGWDWEDGGVFDLRAGPLLVVLGETSTAFARCDVLVLTPDLDWKPAGLPTQLGIPAAERTPLEMTSLDPARRRAPEPLRGVDPAPAATLDNGAVRITFHRARSGGQAAIAQRIAVRAGEWKTLAADPSAESYRVLYRPAGSDPGIVASQVYPRWDASLAPEVRVSAGGASLQTRAGPATAPWNAGVTCALRPSAARQRDVATVELEFAALPEGRLAAVWHLASGAAAAELSLRFVPARAGHVSLGYHGVVAAAPADLDFLLLPFMFHGRRLPASAVTMLDSLTPTPLALVNRNGISYAIVAPADALATDWPAATNARYAFGIRNETGQAQPFVYSPVLGEPGSTAAADHAVDARLLVWAQPGDWYAAWSRIVHDEFHLRDYRRPVYGSLSDAALNLYDLMKSGLGWDGRAKGPWNIEAQNTVSQSSPLLYLSMALLTGDADFYRRYALPSLEFLLSRATPHFAAVEPYGRYYNGSPLGGPAAPYGATVLESAYVMLQRGAPAFSELSRTSEGDPRPTGPNGHIQPFEDALALYRATGDVQWRQRAVEGADRYIASSVKHLPAADLGTQPFVNVAFVPDWEGLLHMFEATGEKRFLDAATEGARWLLTTIWVHPAVAAGDRTIHPGGRFSGERHLWYFGDHRFRLGVYDERTAGAPPPATLPPSLAPEKRVPEWQVSNVGLGLEQPFTYARSGNEANILMNAWAPNLLRLAALTGDDLFRTAARNAIIGRFSTYPGYYVMGYTDLYQKPDYPTTGPDVTSLYYHHIPSFAAFVLDYLFTDAEVRSHGEVRFPAARQDGYVWFDSRLYGHAPGEIYGMKAWPWLHRTAATVDNINIDRILAHGDGRFHVVLLNQVWESQTVRVRFDAAVLGRALDGARADLRLNGNPATTVAIRGGAAAVTLPPFGMAVLTLNGIKIDVPAHRVAAVPPQSPAPAIEHQRIAGSPLEAIGTVIGAPAFGARDLYVYVAADAKQCTHAKLFWKVGGAPERETAVDRFPCEFSVPIDDRAAPVAWRVAIP